MREREKYEREKYERKKYDRERNLSCKERQKIGRRKEMFDLMMHSTYIIK